jgi:hypothetical protein
MAKLIVENINVSNLPQAIKGMRNPLESYRDSDSKVRFVDLNNVADGDLSYPIGYLPLQEYKAEMGPCVGFELGDKDKDLALRLVRAGTDHSKFMRQIGFIADITAPMTWWWDMDTYKVATVKNSTSRMHKLGSRRLTREDMGWDEMDDETETFRNMLLDNLNNRITEWRKVKGDKTLDQTVVRMMWRSIIDDLPQSYMFLATWSGNYQILRNIYFSREGHKQVEFDAFRALIERLPYSELITVK